MFGGEGVLFDGYAGFVTWQRISKQRKHKKKKTDLTQIQVIVVEGTILSSLNKFQIQLIVTEI